MLGIIFFVKKKLKEKLFGTNFLVHFTFTRYANYCTLQKYTYIHTTSIHIFIYTPFSFGVTKFISYFESEAKNQNFLYEII